jgi:cell division protein ZapA
MKKTVSICIRGQRYLVRSEKDERYLNQLAGYVNKRLQEVYEGAKGASSQDLFVLTALNIADELFVSNNQYQNLKQILKVKTQHIIDQIDTYLGKTQKKS